MRFLSVLLLCLVAFGTPVLAEDSAEITFWDSVRDSKNPDELKAYLDAYPNGKFAPLARIRIKSLGGTAPAAAQPEAKPQAQTQQKAAATTATAKKGPQLTPEKATYGPLEPIVVDWSGVPASLRSGWIQVRKQGDTAEVARVSVDFYSKKSGSTKLDGLLPGSYDLSLLTPPYGKEYTLARASFTVAEPGAAGSGEGAVLTLASETVGPFEPIEVSYDKLPASLRTGWVRMAKEDGTEVARQSFSINGDQHSGKVTFDGTLPGTYKFDLLAPPYGKELLLASTSVTVVDPNAQPAADGQADQPAGQPAGEAQPPADTQGDAQPAPADDTGQPAAAPQEQAAAPAPQQPTEQPAQPAAPAGSVEHSVLGNIAFADRPNAADPNLGPVLLKALKGEVNVTCAGTTEGYTWKMAQNDDARLQKLLTDDTVALKGNGYAVSEIPVKLDNMLIYKAKGKDSLLLIWLYDEASRTLNMLLCPTR